MKELSLLMFFIACGYMLNQAVNHFTNNNIRKFIFFIPSYTTFNILWGLIFYIGFAALMLPAHWMKVLLSCTILVLFGIIIYYHKLKQNILTPKSNFFLHIITEKLQKQQQNDQLLNRPYTQKEALKLLGLPLGLEEQSPQILQRLKNLSNLKIKIPDSPYIDELIIALHTTFTLK